jgi:hypothetical protein
MILPVPPVSVASLMVIQGVLRMRSVVEATVCTERAGQAALIAETDTVIQARTVETVILTVPVPLVKLAVEVHAIQVRAFVVEECGGLETMLAAEVICHIILIMRNVVYQVRLEVVSIPVTPPGFVVLINPVVRELTRCGVWIVILPLLEAAPLSIPGTELTTSLREPPCEIS